jgi:hypothetical protein
MSRGFWRGVYFFMNYFVQKKNKKKRYKRRKIRFLSNIYGNKPKQVDSGLVMEWVWPLVWHSGTPSVLVSGASNLNRHLPCVGKAGSKVDGLLLFRFSARN